MATETLGTCEHCHTPLAETGAPIWEIYCPNPECTVERDRMFVELRTRTRAAIALREAAPDLLEVLEELFVRGPVHCALAGNPNACEALEAKARAAIAKARGQ
jgi:hypothetical protein